MGRKHGKIDVEKRIKKGYGRGRGKDYRPWLPVQAFSSRGYVSRVPGWKTGREHHLLSNLELDFFYIADLSNPVVDIREQYPLLPVEETVAIATALGIRHPVFPKTKAPAVLTTDFLITRASDPRQVEEATTIKPANELQSSRTLEKLEIERQYWHARNVNWGIVTDRDMPRNLVRNLAWLHAWFKIPENLKLPEGCLAKVDSLVRERLNGGSGLACAAGACDDRLGLEPGTSLSLVRHFIATRRWRVDLNILIDPAVPLKLLDPRA